GPEVIEPNEVGGPLPAVDMGEQGGIGSHLDYVGIAFEAGHERGFRHGALPGIAIGRRHGMIALGGVFAGEDLGSVAVIVIVAANILQEPFRIAVVVFVEDIGVQAAEGIVEEVESIAIGVRAGAVDETDIGIAAFDGL